MIVTPYFTFPKTSFMYSSGIVTWNFAQAEALNRKRKLSENNGTENPNKRRKLDNKVGHLTRI